MFETNQTMTIPQPLIEASRSDTFPAANHVEQVSLSWEIL